MVIDGSTPEVEAGIAVGSRPTWSTLANQGYIRRLGVNVGCGIALAASLSPREDSPMKSRKGHTHRELDRAAF